MRAERDHTRLAPERRPGNYTMAIVGGTALLLAILLYIGLGNSDEPDGAAPAAIVRDSAVVEAPVVGNEPSAVTQAQPEAAASSVAAETPRRDFNERQLAPPTSTVGAGVAPISESANSNRFVIDGDLLKELEEDAEVRAGEASPNQLRTPQ